MNKELNIFTLRMLREQYQAEHLDTEAEALDAAIEALEQPDLQPTCNNLATDCISRKDVLNWLNDEWDGMVLSVFDGIRNLPSAQPYTEEEIQKMQDLEQAELDKAFELGQQDAQPEPHWIPCSERLPEAEDMYKQPCRRYLCQSKINPNMIICARLSGKFEFDEFWDWYGMKIRDDIVTAWMPLPEPWRGE